MNMGNIASPWRYDEGLCASTDAPRLRHPVGGSRTSGQQQRAGLGVRRAPVLLPIGGFELALRSRFGDDLLVEPSHGVDSEHGEVEVERLYPELAHGA